MKSSLSAISFIGRALALYLKRHRHSPRLEKRTSWQYRVFLSINMGCLSTYLPSLIFVIILPCSGEVILLFHSFLQLMRERNVLYSKSANIDVNHIQKHLRGNVQDTVWPKIWAPRPSQVDTESKPSQAVMRKLLENKPTCIIRYTQRACLCKSYAKWFLSFKNTLLEGTLGRFEWKLVCCSNRNNFTGKK